MVWLRRGAVLVVVATAAACASGGGGGPDAGHEMEIGYKAARRGYWQEALMRFERAVTYAPGDGEALNNLAVALEVTGRYDAARRTYQQAREAAPGNRQIRQNQERFEEFYETFIARDEAVETAEATP